MERTKPGIGRPRLDLRTVLGLVDPDLPNWRDVRALQLRDLQRIMPLVWAINIFNGVALASVVWGTVAHWMTLSWFAALLGIVALAMMADRTTHRGSSAAASRVMRLTMLRSLAGGAIWGAVPLLFAPAGGTEQQVAICLVLGGMIVSAPITLSAIPLPMIAFVLPMSIGLTVMMARTGSPVLAMLPSIYSACLIAGGLAGGRATLRRRWAEVALDEETSLVSLLLHESEGDGADWLWEIDLRKRLTGVGPALAQAFDVPPEALEGQSLIALLSAGRDETDEPPAGLRALIDLFDARQSFRDHDLPVWIGGEWRWWRLSATPKYDVDRRFAGFRGVGSDVTEQRRSFDRIDRLARADGLTGIANRMGFTERLRAAVAAAHAGGDPCALILIDLDRFKAVNDNYGHPVGDRLLHAAARRLAGLAAKGDLCGRLGGDEFAILIGDARDGERIDTVCRRACAVLGQPFEIDGHVLQVGASIGTASAPADGDGVETLMRNADLALYRAKGLGRGNHQHFEPGLLDRAERRLAIERGLRDALAHDALRLVYQPVIAVADGRVTGFEALLRWTHPELGAVSPDEFVPIAGAARLMGPIGDWVLHTACREAARWPAPVGLSINLTANQALDARLPMAIRAALALSALPAGRLALEISEASLIDGGDALAEAVDRLHATGVRLVLDDFGTGFGCIRRSRFASVKIARTLLSAPDGTTPDSIALIRALVTMADALGVTTIAKGAETDDQQALARALGCHHIQGFASGPPLAPALAGALAAAQAHPRRHVA